MRHRHIVKKRQEGWWEQLKSAHDAWSGWVCVFLVGLAAGESRTFVVVVVVFFCCCGFFLVFCSLCGGGGEAGEGGIENCS